MSDLDLTFRQRLGWIAHVLKAATQNHHPEVERFFAPMIAPDSVIADIGAHAGQYSKIFSRLAPQGQIYAFEPSSYALSILPIALGWNGMKNVTIEPYGLSDAPGRFTMSTPLKRGRAEVGFGLAHLGVDDDSRPMRVESIEVRTLDAFVEERQLTRLDFVKADVEGWEARMLVGGEATLTRFRPTLFLEVAEFSLARAQSTSADVFNVLSRIGYRARKWNPEGTATDVPGFAGDGDYLFVAVP